MVVNDPIADFLARINNAVKRKHLKVKMDHSKMKEEIANILVREGFIDHYKVLSDNKGFKNLTLFLKYGHGTQESVVQGLKRVSKPGIRIYSKAADMPRVKNNLGIAIVSTSRGIMTNKACIESNIGGEILCYIW